MRKHYAREIKSQHQDDGRRFFISKQTRPQAIRSRLPYLAYSCRLALFFISFTFVCFAVKNSNFMQMKSSLISFTKNKISPFRIMKRHHNHIVSYDSEKKCSWESHLLFMTLVLTFSFGMFSFIAVVSCRRRGSCQIGDVRRLGKAA